MSDLTFQVCDTCGAFKCGEEFLVSSPGDTKVKWDKDKMFTRVCRHTNKPCINSNGVINPTETLEYRSAEVDRNINDRL